MAKEPTKPVPKSTGNPADQYSSTDPSGPLGRSSATQNAPPMWERETRGLLPGEAGRGSVSYMEHAEKMRIPLYYSGDEWKPMNTPQIVPGLQAKLIAAGLLDPKKVRPGVWDDASATAYLTVLEMANRRGMPASLMLAELAANPSLEGAEEVDAPIALTNPAELRESFRETFRSRVGHNPPPAAMDAFVNQYHAIEQRAGKALNDAQPGATYTQAPSAETAAEEEIRRKYEAEEHAYGTITRQQDFFGMLDAIA